MKRSSICSSFFTTLLPAKLKSTFQASMKHLGQILKWLKFGPHSLQSKRTGARQLTPSEIGLHFSSHLEEVPEFETGPENEKIAVPCNTVHVPGTFFGAANALEYSPVTDYCAQRFTLEERSILCSLFPEGKVGMARIRHLKNTDPKFKKIWESLTVPSEGGNKTEIQAYNSIRATLKPKK